MIPDESKSLSYLTTPNQDSLFIDLCTSVEVSDVIKSLDVIKSEER